MTNSACRLDRYRQLGLGRHLATRAGAWGIFPGDFRRGPLSRRRCYQETGQVIFARHGEDGLRKLDDLIWTTRAEIVPHDETLARLAVDAFHRYGKGIHPKARLNLGDCAAYALSKKTGAPLLFKGNDFAATDIVTATP